LNQQPVILADAFTRSGLAVARSLGRHGLKVIAVSRTSRNLVARSRFVTENLVGPDPVTDRDGYASFIADVATRHEPSLVIPVTDAAVSALSERREHLPPATRLALPDVAVVRSVLDKRLNLEVARAAGIPCPADYGSLSRERLAGTGEELEFPIVLKNADPDNKTLNHPLPFRVALAKDMQELETLLTVVEQSDSDVLFQQFISGGVKNVCVFAIEGVVQGMHGYQSIRRTLHEGIARETIALPENIAGHVRDLMRALRWTGIALVQFLIDAESGEPFYMETNGRFWASTQGSIHAGWNFPVWQYEYFVNGQKPDIQPIQLGSRTVYRKADLVQLLRYWLGGRPPSVGSRGRLSAAWQVLQDCRPSVHSDVGSWSDPLPSLWDALDTFRPSNFRKSRDYF